MSANTSPSTLAGPLLLGYMLNWGLYGVLTVQIYLYSIAFQTDRRIHQTLVYGLYILETSQTISLTYDGFQQFVFGFEDPASVNNSQNVWLNTCIFDGFIALLFQLFFANRIHALLPKDLKNTVITAIIVSLSITQFGGSLAQGINNKRVPLFSDLTSLVPPFIATSCMLIADILIVVTMVHALSRYDTAFRETSNFLKRLKILSLETGGIIAIINIIATISVAIRPNEPFYIPAALAASKLYSNSLLAILNARITATRGGRNRNTTRRRMNVSGAPEWRTNISVTGNFVVTRTRDPVTLTTPNVHPGASK